MAFLSNRAEVIRYFPQPRRGFLRIARPFRAGAEYRKTFARLLRGRDVPEQAFDRTFFNPDIRYTNMRSMGSRTIPYRMFLRRPDDTPIGGPKAAGERDVIAYTDMYVQQNWKRGIPTTQTGFYLVLWDDGQIEKIPWNKLLYVPYGEMAQRMRAGESPKAVIRSHSREIRNGPGYVIPFRQGFPGQAGLGTQAISWEEYHREI